IIDFEIPLYTENDATVITTYLRAAFVKQYPELYNKLSISLEWLPNSEIQAYVYINLSMQNNGVTPKHYFIRNGEVFFYHDCAEESIIIYDLTGDNNRPATLTLSGSQQSVSYQLLRNGSPHQAAVMGTGNPLEFTSINTGGYYKVVASFRDKNVPMTGQYRTPDVDLNLSQDNYIVERTVIEAIGSDPGKISRENSISKVTYLDGLQRPQQIIAVGASPMGGSIVEQVEYDFKGRSDVTSYLPYVTPNDNQLKRGSTVAEQKAFYQQQFPGDVDNAYTSAHKVYDRSPLGLVMAQGSIGKLGDLNEGAPVEYGYRLSTSADAIKKYTVSSDGSLVFSGYYPAGLLTVQYSQKVNTGMDTPVTLRYSDTQGNCIATETRVGANDRCITYYVYDDLGRQRYVIPAVLDAELVSTGTYQLSSLAHYAYYLEYDNMGRVVRSYVPGAGCTMSIYDNKGRLVLSQSEKQREENKWSFVKYDVLGSAAMNGIITGGTYESHLAAVRAHSVTHESRGGTMHGYTNVAYPIIQNAGDVLNVTYYDDYNWLTGSDFAFTADDVATAYNGEVAGQVTGTLTEVLGIAADKWLTEVIYYDDDYLTVQSVSELYPSGKEIVSNLNDFNGRAVRARVRQTFGGQSYEYDKWLEYDDFGRLLSIDQKVAGDTYNDRVTVVTYGYDELGNVIVNNLHNGSYTTTHDHSIGGQRMGSKSLDFSYTLGFDKALIPGVTPRRDGNLTSIMWTNSENSGTTFAYNFGYDQLGQLSSAIYAENRADTWSLSTGKYDEKDISYDLNGNITSLLRNDNSGKPRHELTYLYNHPSNGNALTGVTMGGIAYDGFLYDADGNMTYDAFNDVHIEYNAVGLPERAYSGGAEVRYIYNAKGAKLANETGGSSTYYTGVMVYTGATGGTPALSHIINDKGTIARTGTAYQYNYFLTDHLGSTRVVLAAS
ncbi:MAG: DUF6443 domain-containing protein, partial [Alistipes sp.]|nr:DUF6443 domain-containing protein [Alistipes sp.]